MSYRIPVLHKGGIFPTFVNIVKTQTEFAFYQNIKP